MGSHVKAVAVRAALEPARLLPPALLIELHEVCLFVIVGQVAAHIGSRHPHQQRRRARDSDDQS